MKTKLTKILCWALAPVVVMTVGLSLFCQPESADGQALKKIADHMGGRYDMAKAGRSYPTFIKITQQDNRYPSYWAGNHAGGKLDVDARFDGLAGNLATTVKGDFVIGVTRAPGKFGMEDELPGGQWANNLYDKAAKQSNFQIHFKGFSNFKYVEPDKKSKGQYAVKGTATGMVKVHGISAPFKGDMTITFNDEDSSARIWTSFEVNASDLNLKGDNPAPLKFRITTTTAQTSEKPKPALDDVGPDLGI